MVGLEFGAIGRIMGRNITTMAALTEEHVNPQRLIGLGLWTGMGIGQMTAWLMLRGECPNASAMIALSTFGPGMSVAGALWIAYLFLKKSRAR
jgi:hypothetical protein